MMRQGLAMAPVGLLLVLALVAAGPENPSPEFTVPDESFGSRISPILLLTRPDVQVELQLEPRQVSGVRTAIASLMEQARTLRGKKGRAAEDDRRRIDEESIRWLSENLTEKQIERLYQVNFQWEGAAAMTRPHVITRLNLTSQQSKAIDRVINQLKSKRLTQGTLTPSEIGNSSGEAYAVLTPSQKAVWKVLLGPPCHFTIGGRTDAAVNPAGHQAVKARVAASR